MIGDASPLAATGFGGTLSRWVGLVLVHPYAQSRLRNPMLGVLLFILALHGCGVGLDLLAAIHDPNELDYGEGIVWQQAALLLTARAYAAASALPVIVFHYPPLYLAFTRLVGLMTPNLLVAGRILTALSACCVATLVAMLVLAASTPRATPGRAPRIDVAVASGLLVLRSNAVHVWAMLMRVDMLAEAFALAGVLVAVRSRSWRGLTAGLLLCVAAVYCKQTELPGGLAVAAIMMLRRPRDAVIAVGISLAVGLVPLIALQWWTDGGFLTNIVLYNVNRTNFESGLHTLLQEKSSVVLFLAIVFAACGCVLRYRKSVFQRLTVRRSVNYSEVAFEVLFVQFILATVMLLSVFKSGSNVNYFLDWLCVGTILLGVFLGGLPVGSTASAVFLVVLSVQAALIPARVMSGQAWQAESRPPTALLDRIRQATRPVASENMVLLMTAGKPVVYEPAIVTELAALGRWDERPLVRMIAHRGFAFMLTSEGFASATTRRSPAVAAAMQEAYPKVEQIAPRLWLRQPLD